MTLDEAIKHAEEVAEEKENEGKLLCQSEGASIGCLTCAKEHRQLAEWLKELKRLREQESENELKDLSKRVEALEKQMRKDKEEQLKKLKAELAYAKFRCALPNIMDMMPHKNGD